ncbi:Putative K(+)-stimulated pyrophosphate-energized sodium pump [Chryseobacterium gleum]|uniref:Putative K(+)-stimulated pyrophosphate-energized sodium pump n=2 Tax=Chryseobacterium gleum TaxID=250 RepID=A0A3S4QZ77_CHRGE|nr:sodium-translocating pyrophosphatase [Chryseobacterium gleum]EFK35023.1 V-type H(+)-translocating pyrophosphatase [Chryseobacterium gleum ATCC 35910]QQY30827.1 sodium-translocating pyrophosphatase [Chryseobacterium gleum]VEE04812.1 Putative K(+)-stimulated pyrophosphate-energized sodium pump [Chryseobacterium gleum]
MDLFVLVPIFGVIALLYTFLQSNWVNKQNAGNEKMKTISGHIADGAMAFLKAEYKILTYFVVVVAILLAVMGSSNANSHWSIGIAFVVGAIFSACAGFIGMKIATKANVRTAEAARTSLSKALKVSFTGGSVMGMGVAGLAVLGLGALFLIIKQIFAPDATVDSHEMERTIEILTGFSLGAESIALFARVGGGIYTKAADVGADLVGKVEAGIPEDDPRNPATIADNVGDNVGDVAGMGADLFGSYVATVLATMVLGRETVSDDAFGGFAPILLPMLIAGTGIIFSMVGTLFVKVNDNEGSSTSSVQNALNLGNWGSIVITAIASYFLVTYILPEKMVLRGHEFTKMGVFGAIMVGLVVGTLMSIITEYYTAMGKRPVSSIVRQSSTGHATNIIGGLSVGMESTLLPIIVLAGGIYGSYLCAGLYGVAIAAAGMMATTAMQLAIDAFGPIADNAGGIAEMSELPKEVREKTDILDAVGNTTAATGKGFAIASAALTALALFAAFVGIAGIDGIDIYRADVLAGLFVGGMIPFIFSSLAITAVGQAAMAMVEEVRRQFREIPGILEGKAQPEYEKCVAISTDASIRKMILPGAIAIISPLLIGFIFGPEVLGGFLAGATVCGVLMGMFQNNAGGAWDNAKKSFEKGVDINGQTYYKGSEPHKASVTGDTVGDPFKDTSGPSMNILIKLMSIVSLVIAPTLAVLHKDKIEANRKAKIESLTGVTGTATVVTDTKAVQVIPSQVQGHLNENGDFVYETGNIQKIKLEGGKTIAIGDGSQLYQLYNVVKQKDKSALDPNKWYTIENLYFETGSSDLKPGYELQLNTLAEILNAYPNLKIKLGGYTDNSGNEESNLSLSNLRAQTAKLKLLELGVSADRIEAEGYGSQHPVCEANDTDECKAKNRRIDVRVLAL